MLDPLRGRTVLLDTARDRDDGILNYVTPAGKILRLRPEANWLAIAHPDENGIDASASRHVTFSGELQYAGDEFIATSDSYVAYIGPRHDNVLVINYDGSIRSVLTPPSRELYPDYELTEFEQVQIDPWDRIWVSDWGQKVLVYSPDGDLIYAPSPGDDFYRYWGNTGWSFFKGIDRQGRLWVDYVRELWIYEIPELALLDLEPSLRKSGGSTRTGLEPTL